jgi:hypothetical protein
MSHADETRAAADTLRKTAGIRPGDPLDAALREVEARPAEMTFDDFVQGLKLSWPKTRIGQAAAAILVCLLAYLVVMGKGDVATLVFGVLLWILGVQKEQRLMLGVAFGATQHLVRQVATKQETHMAQIDEQISRVQAGVNNIRANPMQGGTPPDPPPPAT